MGELQPLQVVDDLVATETEPMANETDRVADGVEADPDVMVNETDSAKVAVADRDDEEVADVADVRLCQSSLRAGRGQDARPKTLHG